MSTICCALKEEQYSLALELNITLIAWCRKTYFRISQYPNHALLMLMCFLYACFIFLTLQYTSKKDQVREARCSGNLGYLQRVALARKLEPPLVQCRIKTLDENYIEFLHLLMQLIETFDKIWAKKYNNPSLGTFLSST